MINIKNISKKFFVKNTTVQALKNINMIIEKNDCFAIVGESGSGKTTLANIILGIYQQNEGEVWYEKNKLYAKRSLKQRKLIQFVQQNPMSTLNPNDDNSKLPKIISSNQPQDAKYLCFNFSGILFFV